MTKFVAIPQSERAFLALLFSKHRHLRTPINAVLQGYCGNAQADDTNDANVAELVIGPFQSGVSLTFIGGDPRHYSAKVLLDNLPNKNLIWFDDASWFEIIKTLPDRDIVPIKRFSFSSDKLNREQLLDMKSRIPVEFVIRQIDLDLASRINAELNANPITVEFDSPLAFIERGLGYCATIRDKIVCGATSGSMCDGNIEIQVDTRVPPISELASLWVMR